MARPRKPRTTALLAAVSLMAGCATPTDRAASSTADPYSCRSATAGAYWLRGVESDACDGPLPDGTFGAEAITGFDPDEVIDHTSGPVTSCTVQLNRVVAGHAVPIPGASGTEDAARDPDYFDGRFCDARGSWRPAPGLYNVTTYYRTSDGTLIETVQGPVVCYAEADCGSGQISASGLGTASATQ